MPEPLRNERAPRLFLVVQLSSERTLERVRQDSSFAEKQQPQPARLLVVRSGSGARALSISARADQQEDTSPRPSSAFKDRASRCTGSHPGSGEAVRSGMHRELTD